jgi:HEAT repeat protein
MRLLPKSASLAAVALLFLGLTLSAYPQTPRKQAEKWQIDGIIAALQDPVVGSRYYALSAISPGFISDDDLASAARGLEPTLQWDGVPENLIVPFLKDKNAFAQAFAIAALGLTHANDQKAAIAARLKDKGQSVRVRESAALALGALGATDQQGELLAILKDRSVDSLVRGAAARALGQMPAANPQTELATILKWKPSYPGLPAIGQPEADDTLRADAALALGSLRATDHEPELIAIAKDDKEVATLRSAAVSALGAMGDRDAVLSIFNNDAIRSDVRTAAILALGQMQARDQEPQLVALLHNPVPGPDAAKALVAMNATNRQPELAALLDDKDHPVNRLQVLYMLAALHDKTHEQELIDLLKDADQRETAFMALAHIGPLDPSTLPALTESYYFNHASQGFVRFWCHYLLGAAPASELVLKRVMFEAGPNNPKPARLASIEEVRATLQAFHQILPAKPENTGFAADSEHQILEIAHEWKNSWSSADRGLFNSLSRQMSDDNAATLRSLIETPVWLAVLQKLWKIIAIQILLWVALLFLYPTSPQVQAFFFWNRWARKFVGLGYVDFCLTWIPSLRHRLLAPFRDELIADARISEENLNDYFSDIQVRRGDTSLPAVQAIPAIAGQIVLEGESGLGKSIFLRQLVNKSPQTIAYFPAESCDQGVFELIQQRLKGKAGDETFLRSIIWSGGLSVIIDGLNEVSVETREKIRRFLDDFPKANVLLATQPILWRLPPKAKVFRILPLTDDRIQTFLESRYRTFLAPAMSETDYCLKCRDYLSNVLGPNQSEEDRIAARMVLSNPMDLNTAAQILSTGETPTLKNLQKQEFAAVDHDFRDTHPGQPFPLRQFSESIYERLLRDEVTLDSTLFFEPIQALLAHKMVLTQNDVDAEGKPVRKWVFRHDKIRDFFLVQAFESVQDERIVKHMDDPRFRGVYLMLASQLPLAQASELRDALVDHAAETKDHHLSDAVVELLKNRRTATAKPSA